MTYAVLLLAAIVLAFAAYVRLAPSDPAVWHVSPTVDAPFDVVQPGRGSATLRLSLTKGAPADLLARLDAIAMDGPRTVRLAGSVAEGRITWVIRSALWGFPDYATAELRPDGLYILSRLRFGESDMGVNAARLTDWLSRL
jgi:Protein of unknown function (DUF1499)